MMHGQPIIKIRFAAILVKSFMTMGYDAVVLGVMTLYQCFRVACCFHITCRVACTVVRIFTCLS